MTQIPEVQQTAAPTSIESAPGAAPTPPEKAAETAPAVDIAKLERDLKAQLGREKADIQRRASAEVQSTKAEVAALRQQLNSIGAAISEQRNMALQEQLAKMPASERALAEVRLLREELKTRERQPAPSPTPIVPAETKEQFIDRRSGEIVASMNGLFGLSRSDALTLADRNALLASLGDDDGEEEFVAAARQLALSRLRGERGTEMSKKGAPAADKTAGAPQPVDAATIAQQVTEQVLQKLGASGGNSPRPTSGGSVQVGSDDVQVSVRGYTPMKGPKATLDSLRAVREEAAKRVVIPKK